MVSGQIDMRKRSTGSELADLWYAAQRVADAVARFSFELGVRFPRGPNGLRAFASPSLVDMVVVSTRVSLPKPESGVMNGR